MSGMQDTSLSAYFNKVLPELNQRQREVLNIIEGQTDPNRIHGQWAHGLTNMEIAFLIGWSINRVTGRVKELRDAGALEELGHRPCRITGNTAIAWRLKK